MLWFNNKKKRLDMIQGIKPTSKATLKLQCLFACNYNIEEAKKLYSFFADDMPNLPDYDPVAPTWQQNTAQTVNGIMAWLKENQDTLAQGYQFIQGIIANRGIIPTATTEEALPPINEE